MKIKLKLKIDSDANFWLPSGIAAMANERCTMVGATTTLCSSVRGGTSFVLGVARHCAHGADLCRGVSCHHGARRLAQAARVKDAYGGHGVGVEQNGRPEHGRSVLLQLTARAKLSGRSRCCSEARTWRTSRANSKRCRPNNEKR